MRLWSGGAESELKPLALLPVRVWLRTLTGWVMLRWVVRAVSRVVCRNWVNDIRRVISKVYRMI